MPFDALTKLLPLTCEILNEDGVTMNDEYFCNVCHKPGGPYGQACTYISELDPPNKCIGTFSDSHA